MYKIGYKTNGSKNGLIGISATIVIAISALVVWRNKNWLKGKRYITGFRIISRGIAFTLVMNALSADAQDITIGKNFTSSTIADSGFFPPDTMGTVGERHIVELINGRYAVYDKVTGARVRSSTLNQFWTDANVEFKGFAFDPRVVYDPFSKRWFAASVDNGRDDNNFLLAVSKTSDPTEGWTGFAIDSNSNDQRWADYPTLGFNKDGVYLSANMFPIFGRGAFDLTNTIIAVSKDELLAASTASAVVKKSGNIPSDIMTSSVQAVVAKDNGTLRYDLLPSVPEAIGATEDEMSFSTSAVTIVREQGSLNSNTMAQSLVGADGDMQRSEPMPSMPGDSYAMEDDASLSHPTLIHVTLFEHNALDDTGFTVQPVVDLDNTGLPAALLSNFIIDSGFLTRSNIIGDITSPTLDAPAAFISIEPFHPPQVFTAEQPGEKQNLEIANGSILHANVVRKNGSLWGVRTVFNGGRAALRWFRLDAETNRLIQEGLIADDELHFYYGSIAVNEFNDVVIGFSGSSESQFVSSYAVLGKTVSGATAFGKPVLLKEGVASYEITHDGRNRWGDYSATVVDPSDSFTFWTFQEFVAAEDVWATQITQLVVVPTEIVNDLVPLSGLKTSFDPTPVPNGPAGTFTITATFANTSTTNIRKPLFEVIKLTGGNLLLNADGGAGGVGATLTPDIGDTVLSPGESFTADFEIGLQKKTNFTFFVNLLGIKAEEQTDQEVANFDSSQVKRQFKTVKYRTSGKRFFGRFRP